MLNKKALIVATSLGAIPLTAVLIAIVTRRAKHGSLQRSTLLGQTRSESSNITTATATTQSQQQKEESQSQSQSESVHHQRSETAEATMTSATTTATTISSNVTDNDKDIPIPVALAVTVSSPMEPPSSTGTASISSTTSQTTKENEISISDEAKKAGESLKELIIEAIKDAKHSAKGTGNRLKEETVDIADTSDSKDIQSLKSNVNTLVVLFERMMTEIRKEHYDEQIKLLQSYKDLLQTQIKVVNARGTMARKLKPGA